jgi:mycothiol system anti-sigma-R factor
MEDASHQKKSDEHAHGMNCTEVANRVYAFLDGQMSLEEVAVYQRHLELCLPCRTLVDFEEKLITMIRAKGGNGSELPSTLMAKIRKALNSSSHLKS